MATRDRTALLLRYREEARALHSRKPISSGEDEFHGSSKGNDFPDGDSSPSVRIIRGGMEPDWVFAFNELSGDMAELEKLLEQLGALYAKHLLPSFGETDTSQLEHDIRIGSHRLTQLLHQVEQKVKNIASKREQPRTEQDKVELLIRRNVQKRFAAPLQQLSLSFRKKQKTYLDSLKEQRENYTEGNGIDFDVLIDPGAEEEAINAQAGGFSETQMLMVESASALAEERTRELTQVAESVNDLATLVKDIASLVVDQGTVLDRVDYNLEDVKLKTFGAVRELRIAERYQRKRHAMCCIIILAVGCGIQMMILIFKWTS